MLRYEIQKKTGLTRKAIEYYENKGLISPAKDKNGYRNYGKDELERLNKISILRKIGISVADIGKILSKDETSLSSLLRKKQIKLDIEGKKKEVLELIIKNWDKEIIEKKLSLIENQETIYEKLERAFPGYFGQMIFASLKPFLDEPLSKDGEKSFLKYISYLDNLPEFSLSKDEKFYIDKLSQSFDMKVLSEINDEKLKAVYNVENWFKENKEKIESYEAFKESNFYKESPISKIQSKFKRYLEENGYYKKAIPLIRQFSKSYDNYYKKLLQANSYYEKNKI